MAGIVNFNIDKRATFTAQLTYQQDDVEDTPVNLTGYTAVLQIRRSTNETGPPLFEVSTTPTTNGSVITIDPSSGGLLVKITDEDTAKFNFKSAVYDLVIESPAGDVSRLIQGTLTIVPGVTVL